MIGAIAEIASVIACILIVFVILPVGIASANRSRIR